MSNQVTVVHKWQNRGVLFLIGAAVCACLLYWIFQSWFRLSGTLDDTPPEKLESVSGVIFGLVVELLIGVGSLTVTASGFAWWLLKDLGSGAIDSFTNLRGTPNETKQVEAALQGNPAFAGVTAKATTQEASEPVDGRKLKSILVGHVARMNAIESRLDKLDPPPPPPPTMEELLAENERLREEAKSKTTRKAVAS